MRKIIIAALCALLSTCAQTAYAGGMMYVAPSYTVTMLDEPCSAASVLQHVPPLAHDKLKQALLVWQGKPLEACWFTVPDGTPYVIDEEGDAGALLPQFGNFERLLEAGDVR